MATFKDGRPSLKKPTTDGMTSSTQAEGAFQIQKPETPICYVCRRDIKEKEFLKYKDLHFHTFHFKCGDCKKPLEPEQFHAKDNRVLCLNCNVKHNSIFCGRCEKQIKTSFIHILDKGWHDECFDCHVCHAKFDDSLQGIHNIDGNPYCETCYNSIDAGECDQCSKKIGLGDLVEALGERYHRECFVCAWEEEPHFLETGTFFKHNDKLYCPQHYEASGLVDKCQRCKRKIDLDYVKIGTKVFHPKCYICGGCKQMIRDDQAGQIGDAFYCLACVKAGKVKGGKGKGKMTSAGVWVPEEDGPDVKEQERFKMVKPKHLVRGYGDLEVPPGVVPPWESKTYPLEILRLRPPRIPKEIDFRQREQYLDDAVFKQVFGMDMVTFNALPDWKRVMMKKEVDLF